MRNGQRANIAAADKTLFDAIERFKAEILPSRRGHRKDALRLDRIAREADFLGSRLRDIDKHDISRWRDMRLGSVSPASVNRDMNTLSAVFVACVRRWDWMTRNPVRDTMRPPATKPRDRRVTEEETAAMCDALGLFIRPKCT